MLRYLVLGPLRDRKPCHGYALMKAYCERAGGRITTGNFYRELQRLAAEGLVRTVPNPEGADPRRAPYEILDAGCEAFDAWIASPLTENGHGEDELSSRALFLSEVDAGVGRRILEDWQQELWLRGKKLERAREVALGQRRENGRPRFDALVLLFARRIKHVGAELEFVEQLRAAYQEWAIHRQPEATREPRPRGAPQAPRRRLRDRS